MAAIDSNAQSRSRTRQRPVPRIDMTPMVDLAFLLLTFFIMTTTLMKQPALEIRQPVTDETAGSKQVEAGRVLNLVLGKNDRVYWYVGLPGSEAHVTDFSSSEVRKLLTQKNTEIKKLYVFIKASDQSRYRNMVDVLDEIIITGIADYAFLNPDPEDYKLIN